MRLANISFKNLIAGRLEETADGGTRYVYRQGWPETIGCCLPVARQEHAWPAGLHPFFQHLGAEGWLRERQARITHTAADDDFGLLLRYGADCIGAVGVLPLARDAARGSETSPLVSPGRTVSGVQRKLLVFRDAASGTYRPARETGPAPFIAKFNSDTRDGLMRNEFLSLRWIGAILGTREVAAFQVGDVAEVNEPALIVTRFDRTDDGEKLRAEDFAQILCRPRGTDYGGKYEASYEEVAGVIQDHSVRPAIDLARFFRRLVAFALVANGDAHLKNFSLLERPEGLRLSPVYDVVNVGVYAYEGVSQRLALAINGDFVDLGSLTRKELEAFGERIGLAKTTVARSFRDLTTRARQSSKLLPHVTDEGRDPFGARYTEVVRTQCANILEA